MKKLICGFLVGAILCSGSVFAASYVAETANFKVFVNGHEFKSDPPALVVDGKTYLPLRAMGDALRVPVEWDEQSGQVNVRSIGSTVPGAAVSCSGTAFAASYAAETANFKIFVNDQEFKSDPPALMVDGRIYLPLRAMGDALGVPVNWNEQLGQVIVGTFDGVPTDGYYKENPFVPDYGYLLGREPGIQAKPDPLRAGGARDGAPVSIYYDYSKDIKDLSNDIGTYTVYLLNNGFVVSQNGEYVNTLNNVSVKIRRRDTDEREVDGVFIIFNRTRTGPIVLPSGITPIMQLKKSSSF